jgi:hypothetical protein
MADKVEARARADATLVNWIAIASKNGEIDPGEIGRYPLAQMTEADATCPQIEVGKVRIAGTGAGGSSASGTGSPLIRVYSAPMTAIGIRSGI